MTFPAYAAGTVSKLTPDVHVTLGKVVEVALHPSGSAYDGPAVIVSAYISNGNNMIKVISPKDPTHRQVALHAEPFAD